MQYDDYSIHSLTVDDIEVLIDLRGRMFEEVGFEDTTTMNAPSVEYFTQAIPSGEFAAFGALSPSDGIVGVAGLSTYQMPPKPTRPDGRFGYVSSMYVLPAHRQRGLARRLLAALTMHAETLDLTWLTLHASQMGQPLYEDIGFQEMNEMALYLPSARNLNND